MDSQVQFFVAGSPKPQGSKRAFMRPGAKFPSVVESAGEALKDWRSAVAYTASQHCNAPIAGPVAVELEFYLQRPKSHFRTGKFAGELRGSAPVLHSQTPDVDKLARGVNDAITGVVIADDSLIVKLVACKYWGFERTGCNIVVCKVGFCRDMEP